ncbi:hypothetical protein SGPA1_11003 [Streptomyces misionensis JCM 4497]
MSASHPPPHPAPGPHARARRWPGRFPPQKHSDSLRHQLPRSPPHVPDHRRGRRSHRSRHDRRPTGPHADHSAAPQTHRGHRRRPVLRHLREQPVRHHRQGAPDRLRLRHDLAQTRPGLRVRGPVHRFPDARPDRRPVRPAPGLPGQPGHLLGLFAARRLLPERHLADRHPVPRRTRHRRRAGPVRLLPRRRAAREQARPVHRLGLHPRLLRGARGRLRRAVAGAAVPARGGRLALAVRARRARLGGRLGAAPPADRVPALARRRRPHRGGRPPGGPPGGRGGRTRAAPGPARPADRDPRRAHPAARRLQARTAAPHPRAVGLLHPVRGRLLRLRHPRPADRRRQGLRRRRGPRLHRAVLPRLPGRLRPRPAGRGPHGAPHPGGRVRRRDGGRGPRLRLRGLRGTHRAQRVRVHAVQQRLLQRLPRLPRRAVPHRDPGHGRGRRLLAVQTQRRSAAVRAAAGPRHPRTGRPVRRHRHRHGRPRRHRAGPRRAHHRCVPEVNHP